MTPENAQQGPFPHQQDIPIERPKTGWRRFVQAMQHPAVLCALQFTMVASAYIANRMIQVYCQPVLWATIALIVSFIPVVFWPYMKRLPQPMLSILQILRGIAFCICLYCILFLGRGNAALPLLIPFGIGLIGLVPHFIAVLLVYQTFAQHARKYMRNFFFVGIGISMLVASYFVWDFRAAIPIAQGLDYLGARYEGPHAHAVEWILGMHFKYHTRQDIGIDGWRPPLHDPAGVIGFWANGMRDPLEGMMYQALKYRIATYHVSFPDEPLMVDCTCANDAYGMSYLSDPMLLLLTNHGKEP